MGSLSTAPRARLGALSLSRRPLAACSRAQRAGGVAASHFNRGIPTRSRDTRCSNPVPRAAPFLAHPVESTDGASAQHWCSLRNYDARARYILRASSVIRRPPCIPQCISPCPCACMAAGCVNLGAFGHCAGTFQPHGARGQQPPGTRRVLYS